MMRSIIEWSLGFRVIVLVIAGALLVFGALTIRDEPVDAVPEFAPVRVEIQTEALGLSAAEVEQLVTVPLEANLFNGVAWVDQIRSASVPGLSSIELIFEPGTDPLAARQMVHERLNLTRDLPRVSRSPVMLQPLSSASRVMMIGLSSDDISLMEMSVLSRWTIRPYLMGIPGVANVTVWGHREQQMQVQVDPERLARDNVSLSDVIETTGNALWVSPLTFLEASTPGTGGFIDTANQRLSIQHIQPIRTPADLAQVAVSRDAAFPGPPVNLGDVAEVVQDHQPLIGDAIVNEGPGLLLVVEKFESANTVDVTRDVEAALDKLAPGLSGINFDSTIYRPANFVEKSNDNVSMALVLAGVLGLAVLALLFNEWRQALVCFVAVALSLLATFVILSVYETSMNLLIVAGIATAIVVIVDDAVFGMHRISHRLRQRREEAGNEPLSASIVEATKAARAPILFATIIALVALLPAFFVDGVSGSFLEPAVRAYGLALIVSSLVAITVTPALSLLLLAGGLPQQAPPLIRLLERRYDSALLGLLRSPLPAYAAIVVIAIVGFAALPRVDDNSLFPSYKEHDLLITWDGAPSASLDEMARITASASEEIRALPGVRNVGAHFGRALQADQIVNINSGEIWVSIDPHADYDKTLGAISDVINGYPGLSQSISTYTDKRIGEERASHGDDLVVRLYGEDPAVLNAEASRLSDTLGAVEGLRGVHVMNEPDIPQAEIEVDLAAAEQHGIKPGDVRRAAATLVTGIEVGNLFEEQKVFDVVVRGTPETRNSLSSIQNLLIDKPAGGRVRLGDVADVRIASTPGTIHREAVSRYVDIGLDVSGRSLDSAASAVGRVLEQERLPLEYHAEVLSGYDDLHNARLRIAGIAVGVVVAVFLVLQAAFSSWRLAGLALLSLPLALVGGLVALELAGRELSFGSLVGFAALLAIAVRGVITIISRCQEFQVNGERPRVEDIVRSANESLAPVLFTAVTAAIVLLPMVVQGHIPGFELLRPMAVVVLGGLVTTTFVNLFVIPVLYLRLVAGAQPHPSGARLTPRQA